jgi:hypothetical protein
MIDIDIFLNTIGLKHKEVMYLVPPALPYIIYLINSKISGADYLNCTSNRSITLELYSEKIDNISEAKIETLLNSNAIKYEKSRQWIDTEKLFQTTYDFNLIEKM